MAQFNHSGNLLVDLDARLVPQSDVNLVEDIESLLCWRLLIFGPLKDEMRNVLYKNTYVPTKFATNQWQPYHNFQIVIPFVLLIVLNIRTYEKIVQFEQTLNQPVRVKFHNKSSRRNNAPNSREVSNAQSFEMVELVEEDENAAAAEFEISKNESFLNRIKSKRFRGSTRLSQKRQGGT